MKCPDCGSTSSFRVSGWMTETAHYDYEKSDNWWECINQKDPECVDSYIHPHSEARCNTCNYVGNIEEFDDGDLPEDLREYNHVPTIKEALLYKAKKFWNHFNKLEAQ